MTENVTPDKTPESPEELHQAVVHPDSKKKMLQSKMVKELNIILDTDNKDVHVVWMCVYAVELNQIHTQTKFVTKDFV